MPDHGGHQSAPPPFTTSVCFWSKPQLKSKFLWLQIMGHTNLPQLLLLPQQINILTTSNEKYLASYGTLHTKGICKLTILHNVPSNCKFSPTWSAGKQFQCITEHWYSLHYHHHQFSIIFKSLQIFLVHARLTTVLVKFINFTQRKQKLVKKFPQTVSHV